MPSKLKDDYNRILPVQEFMNRHGIYNLAAYEPANLKIASDLGMSSLYRGLYEHV